MPFTFSQFALGNLSLMYGSRHLVLSQGRLVHPILDQTEMRVVSYEESQERRVEMSVIRQMSLRLSEEILDWKLRQDLCGVWFWLLVYDNYLQGKVKEWKG